MITNVDEGTNHNVHTYTRCGRNGGTSEQEVIPYAKIN